MVQETEPGMLYHSLDSHDDCALSYSWTMILQDHDALLAHLANTKVNTFVMALGELLEGGLEEGFKIEIWGDIADETRETIEGMKAFMPVPISICYYTKKLGLTPELLKYEDD